MHNALTVVWPLLTEGEAVVFTDHIRGDGYGYGRGNGNGYGDGNGRGYGDGYGYGNGDGGKG
jgi:hypothetical protein